MTLFNSYKIVISYQGSQYFGWQSQPSGNTVQQEFEKTLKKILPRSDIKIVAASRTDSGVHALGQVVRLRSTQKIEDLPSFAYSLSCILNTHIGLISIEEACPDFHPIRDAKSKSYRYRLFRSSYLSPFYREFSWQVRGLLDKDRLDSELQKIEGTHSFTSFCAADSSAKTMVRTIYAARSYQPVPDVLDLWFVGNGFLKQMVRCLVGTLVGQAQGKIEKSMTEIIASGNRSAAGLTAPARGLFLMNVDYDDNPLEFMHKNWRDL